MRAPWRKFRYIVGASRILSRGRTGKAVRRTTWPRVFTGFLGIGLILFLPALLAYFCCDDFMHLARVIEGGLPFYPEVGHRGGFLRPLIGIGFWLEYHLWGLHPFGFHLVNVLLHVLNSVLVVKLTLLLLPHEARRRTFTSVSAGLFFLVMACHAEPVSWISGRTDVLATTFILASLCAGCGWLRGRSTQWALLGLFAFAMALLTKESAIALPFVLLVCSVYLASLGAIKRARIELTIWAVSFGGLFGLYFLFRKWMIGEFIGGYGAHGHLRLHTELMARSLSRFAWRVYFPPLPSGAEVWIAPFAGPLVVAFFLGFIAVLLVLALLAWRRRATAVALFLFCAFWAALAPAINMPIAWTDFEGERFLYLASVFAAMGVAHALVALPRAPMRLGLLALFLCCQGFLLLSGTLRWHNAGAIAQETVYGIQAEYSSGTIILANKPDSYAGALVLRTGLPEALCYFGPTPLGRVDVEVLYATGIFEAGHTFVLQPEDAALNSFRLYATDPTSTLIEEDRADLIVTTYATKQEVFFTFHDTRERAPLFVIDSHGVRKVDR